MANFVEVQKMDYEMALLNVETIHAMWRYDSEDMVVLKIKDGEEMKDLYIRNKYEEVKKAIITMPGSTITELKALEVPETCKRS